MNRGGRQGAMMDLERRAQQIKEVVRVSAALRADMPPEVICAQVVGTIHTTLGFHAAVINLIVPRSRHFIIAATAGISEAERQRLINDPPPVDHVLSLMRPEFQVSRSYFISHEHKYLLEGAGGINLLTRSASAAPRGPNAWHPDDVFFVPLFSMRENRLLGLISLDLPEDGKIPSFETVEIIELLANQAATALDTARLFQERDQERQAMEYGLAELLSHLERMRQRDFSARAQLRATALNPVAGALNDVSETLGNVLADVRDAGMVVRQQASEMRNTAVHLVNSAQRQAEQIRTVSDAVQHTSEEMRRIVVRAADSSAIAEEAETISTGGREAAERAGEGMNAVREITLQASKRIKRLGESSQEIGNVIQLVSEFASQTHLLALNAAIEAANAGEHGAGFAIVAREIRNLAQNSNDATKQIHARIKGIQNETNQVAITIEHATQQVVLLSDLVTRTGSALHAIDTVIQRVASVIATVHQTAEEQARATAIVSGTMSNIADITGTTWESAEQMRASMDHMAELAGILQAKIDMFRLSERLQANPATALPTQPPASTPPRNTPTPARSFPAVSFPAAPSPAASFPAKSFPGAPAPDPYARSTPAATPQPAPATGTPGVNDMELLPTVPMPVFQTPPPNVDGSVDLGDAPAPLFPVSSSPLTPMRLAMIDDDTASNHALHAVHAPPALPADALDSVNDNVDDVGVQTPDADANSAPTAETSADQPADDVLDMPTIPDMRTVSDAPDTLAPEPALEPTVKLTHGPAPMPETTNEAAVVTAAAPEPTAQDAAQDAASEQAFAVAEESEESGETPQ